MLGLMLALQLLRTKLLLLLLVVFAPVIAAVEVVVEEAEVKAITELEIDGVGERE